MIFEFMQKKNKKRVLQRSTSLFFDFYQAFGTDFIVWVSGRDDNLVFSNFKSFCVQFGYSLGVCLQGVGFRLFACVNFHFYLNLLAVFDGYLEIFGFII